MRCAYRHRKGIVLLVTNTQPFMPVRSVGARRRIGTVLKTVSIGKPLAATVMLLGLQSDVIEVRPRGQTLWLHSNRESMNAAVVL